MNNNTIINNMRINVKRIVIQKLQSSQNYIIKFNSILINKLTC